MENCICCHGVTKSEQRFGYDEITCLECGFVHYCDGIGVSSEHYSSSEKYQNYKEKPPILWYHRKTLEFLKQTDKVHDLGCHDGFFVKHLIESGFDADGSDWDKRAISMGSNIYGLDDKLTESPLGQYDVIVALEVLEHFEKPDEFFEIAKNHLLTDGLLIISVPNRNSLYRPGVDYPPHHFSRFCSNSISYLAEKHNFGVVHLDMEMNLQMLLRNYVGDRLRKKRIDFEQHAYSRKYYVIKHIYNKVAGLVDKLCFPLNQILKFFGVRYGSLFLVLKRRA